MEVLIVAKTKWGDFFCIGGIELQTNRYTRLMDLNGGYQPSNTKYKVGEVWDINYTKYPTKPPHIEDVRVSGARLIGTLDPKEYILANCTIWKGELHNIFNSKLRWENGSGFLDDPKNIPVNSVGFWQNDKDLTFKYNKYYIYSSLFKADKKMPYKGDVMPLSTIPAGTLIRVSLAKWWHPKDNPTIGDKCYLQLSGWYN